MNKQIKELAEQAGLRIEHQMINPPKPFQILGSAEQFEKFAELIVKETMQVVANQLPSNQYLDVAHAVIEHYKDH